MASTARDALIFKLLSEDNTDHSLESSCRDGPGAPKRAKLPLRAPASTSHINHTVKDLAPRTQNQQNAGTKHVYERLVHQQHETEQRVMQLRCELEEKEMAQCTFVPKTNTKAKPKATNNAHLRLFHDAQIRKSKRANSSQPRLVRSPCLSAQAPRAPADPSYQPLHKRVRKIQKAKQDKLHQLRMKHISGGESPPTRPPSTHRAAAGRLSHPDTAGTRHRAARLQQIRDDEMKECTFKPEVSSVSEQLVRLRGQNFWDRNDAAVRSELENKAQIDPENCTFKPSIGNAHQVLAATRPERLLEQPAQRWQRLSVHDARAAADRKHAMGEAQLNQWAFQPKIDAVSAKIATTSSIEALSQPREPSAKQQGWHMAREAWLRKHCTFAPQLNKHSKKITSNDGVWKSYSLQATNPDTLLERIASIRASKAAAAQAAQQRQEFAELQECTFAPQTETQTKRGTRQPVVVNGLGKHLQRQQALQHKTQHTPPPAPKTSITIPQPFFQKA